MTPSPVDASRFDDTYRVDDEFRVVVAALLDTIVPASEDGRMPSAADVGFLAHLERLHPGYLPEFERVLRCFDAEFARLDLGARVARVAAFSSDDPALFGRLVLRVYDCYYQDALVRIAIGATATPPFPEGNPLREGDLSLLEPVIRNRDRHRHRPI